MVFSKTPKYKISDAALENFDCLVGIKTIIYGRVVSSNSIRVDGSVFGNVENQDDAEICVAIGKKGYVVGDIKADRVFVAGKVEGHINVSGRVELRKDCVVKGNITCDSIGIEPGSNLLGMVNLINKNK